MLAKIFHLEMLHLSFPILHLLLRYLHLGTWCLVQIIYSVQSDNILIVYLSRTNNTKAIAEIIHENIGGMLVALELENPYPENYGATVDQVAKENETGFLPALKTKVDNIQQYDVVFVGFPTWACNCPHQWKAF